MLHLEHRRLQHSRVSLAKEPGTAFHRAAQLQQKVGGLLLSLLTMQQVA